MVWSTLMLFLPAAQSMTICRSCCWLIIAFLRIWVTNLLKERRYELFSLIILLHVLENAVYTLCMCHNNMKMHNKNTVIKHSTYWKDTYALQQFALVFMGPVFFPIGFPDLCKIGKWQLKYFCKMYFGLTCIF